MRPAQSSGADSDAPHDGKAKRNMGRTPWSADSSLLSSTCAHLAGTKLPVSLETFSHCQSGILVIARPQCGVGFSKLQIPQFSRVSHLNAPEKWAQVELRMTNVNRASRKQESAEPLAGAVSFPA